MSVARGEAAEQRWEILRLLERLHRHKDAAYADAWRKRGEVIAIFANMARKYDRLLVAFDEQRPAASEPLGDTVADLLIYTGKYFTWIAEQHPAEFAAATLGIDPRLLSPAQGPEPMARVLRLLADEQRITPPAHSADAWLEVKASFDALDRALMAQSTPGRPPAALLDFTAKTELAWRLCAQLGWLLTLLERGDPTVLDAVRAQVTKMDRRAEA